MCAHATILVEGITCLEYDLGKQVLSDFKLFHQINFFSLIKIIIPEQKLESNE